MSLCEINRDKVTKGDKACCKSWLLYHMLHPYSLSRLWKEGLIDTEYTYRRCKVRHIRRRTWCKTPNLFCEVNESMKAYGVASHGHTPLR